MCPEVRMNEGVRVFVCVTCFPSFSAADDGVAYLFPPALSTVVFDGHIHDNSVVPDLHLKKIFLHSNCMYFLE